MILPAFRKYPKEAEIIGRLLAGYADLEIDVMNCVQVVRSDLDTVLKVMFRMRGESQRMAAADAMGRQYYEDLKLGTEFAMAMGSVAFCLKLRNQYAHCVWYDDNSGRLAFVNLEEVAEKKELIKDLSGLTSHYATIPLLAAQEEYFLYTVSLLIWMNFQGQLRSGKIKQEIGVKPTEPKRPEPHVA